MTELQKQKENSPCLLNEIQTQSPIQIVNIVKGQWLRALLPNIWCNATVAFCSISAATTTLLLPFYNCFGSISFFVLKFYSLFFWECYWNWNRGNKIWTTNKIKPQHSQPLIKIYYFFYSISALVRGTMKATAWFGVDSMGVQFNWRPCLLTKNTTNNKPFLIPFPVHKNINSSRPK